jgi:hypothetical protein
MIKHLAALLSAPIFAAFISAASAQPLTTKPSLTNMLTANCSASQVLLGGAVSPGCGPTPTRAGDLLYFNGASYVSLAGNNSGTQVLQETAAGVPSWATVSGAGTVTSVTCGTGLSGGTFTTTGTCALSTPVTVANGGTGDTGTAWSQTTPTPAAVGGAFTTVSAVVHTKSIGKTIYVWATVVVTAVGTATSGFSVAVPTAALNTSPVAGIDNNIGTGFLAYVSGSTLNFSVAPANHTYYANGSYESN